eukprot:527255_1
MIWWCLIKVHCVLRPLSPLKRVSRENRMSTCQLILSLHSCMHDLYIIQQEEETDVIETEEKTEPNTWIIHCDRPSFVMEFVYNIGDISHAVDESAPIIRQGIMIILKEYIKILKDDDDGLQNNIGDEYELDNTFKSRRSGLSHHHHSFYVGLPIYLG